MKTHYDVPINYMDIILLDLKWMFEEFDVYACIYEDDQVIFKRDFTFYRGQAYNYNQLTFSSEDKTRNFRMIYEVPNSDKEDLHTWIFLNKIIDTIFENINDVVFFKDKDLRYKYVNQVFRKVTNISGMCIVNFHHSDILGPNYIFPIEKEIYVLNTKEAVETEMNFNTGYRSLSYTETIESILDDTGQVIGIYAIVKSLDIKHNADIKLHVKREIEEVLDDLGVYYFESIGSNDYILRLMDPMLEKLGYAKEEIPILKTSVFHYVHEDDLKVFAANYLKRMKTTQGDITYTQDLRVKAKDGTYRWFRYHEKKFYPERPEFLAGIFVDIHDVIESKENAIRSAKDKAMFLASMSHEIRTPLNAILGFSELLNQIDLDDKENEYAFKIRNASITLIELINNVLDFSKIEAGKLETHVIPFNIHQSLGLLYNLFESKASSKGLQLHFHIDEDVEESFMGDELRINQILTNLLNNAIKFTEEGYVKLEVNKDDNHMLFSIIDTGIGMSNRKIEKIFTLYEQAETSTSQKYGGTGLGLSISRQLAYLLGGDIKVKSSLRKGSTFTFSCPIYKTINKVTSKPVHDIKDFSNVYQGCRLLIVDDVDDNRQVIADILSPLGFDILFAENGFEAVQLLKLDFSINLIIMDLQMPVMDGFEATKEIRHFFTGDQLPIIALTADTNLSTLRRTLEYDMQGHLLKPVFPKKLIQSVVEALPRSSFLLDDSHEDHETEQILDDLSEILDVEEALDRFANNTGLYLDLISDYIEQFEKIPPSFDSANEKIRFYHNLKGASGNLGASEIQNMTKEIENFIASGKDISSLKTSLSTALEDLSKEIRAIITPYKHKTKRHFRPLSESLDKLILTLKDSLIEHAIYSKDILINNEDELINKFGKKRYERLVNLVSDYEFARALSIYEEVFDAR
ncbi:response regulator [Acidaminobacter sp. JC074]|uniref:ATP-binding protein n=1 Tax=Acidaminobacter sp. JC074 TaxID=2530199 RepID=UPI001F0E2822|nr:ATP-binding protein [Acidaminobacter sp. JC074]MCH4888348.1 response regulator [Acidaminobacter sp. JC074]